MLKWTIQVCRYCGAKAEWPGQCEHWETKRGVDPNWCMTVLVRPAADSLGRLRKAMAEVDR